MPDPHPEANQIWLVLPSSSPGGPHGGLSSRLSPLVRTLSFTFALEQLESGKAPAIILLHAKPDRTAERLIAELKDSGPQVLVFLVSHWASAEELRDWISKSLFEAFQPPVALPRPEAANPYHLSFREIEVLRLMTRGLIKKEIGEQLAISYHTIVHHERSIYEKLNVHTRAAAVAKALMEKLC